MDKKIEVLLEAIKYIDTFMETIGAVVDNIKQGKNKEVYSVVVQMSDGIEWLLNVFKMTQDIQLGEVDVDSITHIIENIVEALENKDFVLLQDVMEYELLDQLREWKRNLLITIEHYSN